MLIEFYVKNYKSIHDEIFISTLADYTKANLKNNFITAIDEEKKRGVLKTCAIYGPNSSGKSNFIESINLLKAIVLYSKDFPVDEPIPYFPFLFTKDNNEPTIFEIKFIKNDYLFQYHIEYNNKKILKEFLKQSQKKKYFKKLKKVFERTDDKQKNNAATSNIKKQYLDEIGENRAYLSVAGFKNSPEVIEAYNWFVSDCLHISTNRNDFGTSEQIRQSSSGFFKWKLYKNKDNKEYCNSFLNQIQKITDIMDLGISSYSYEYSENDYPQLKDERFKEIIKLNFNFQIYGIHKIQDKEYQLSIGDESEGTKKIIDLLTILLNLNKNGGIFIIDEIDCSLHPELFKKLILIIHNYIKNIQVIFTCHDSILLDTDIMQKEQIWFVEKSKETQSTDLYSLADIKGVKDKSVKTDYFKGIFGAYPDIKLLNLMGEDSNE